MFGYIVCQETRDYTEDIEQGLEASDLDFGEVCDAVFHTFELMAEDAAADPGAYATHFQRCHDYLADGLGEGFDQTASYTYTDPAGDSCVSSSPSFTKNHRSFQSSSLKFFTDHHGALGCPGRLPPGVVRHRFQGASLTRRPRRRA